jgi:hypothetical protein
MNMSGEKRLAATFLVTLLILAAEVVGGYMSVYKQQPWYLLY